MDRSKSRSSRGYGVGYLIVESYILLYNFLQTLGWSHILFQFVTYCLTTQPEKSLYETVKWNLLVFQNAAVLEVIHAAIGIVQTSALLTGLQIYSRVWMVCGVLAVADQPKESIGLSLIILAWSLTEIIRYGFYTLSLVNAVPPIVVWLRYTTFIILYPIGVIGELLCTSAALKEASQNNILNYELPNPWNFTVNYSFVLVCSTALPFFPTFYRHMFALRIKALGSDTKERKGSQLRRLGLCILVINVQFLLIYNTESYKRISDHFSINS